jgi:methyl-accepting chemotaxis protein
MNILKNTKIAHRLWLLIFLVMAGMAVLTLYSLNQFRIALLEEKHTQTKVLVESAHSVVQGYYDRYKTGKLSEQIAKSSAWVFRRT